MTAQTKLRAVKTLVRVTKFSTLNDIFRIRPRTEVSSLLIVQPAAKIQSPEPRVDSIAPSRSARRREGPHSHRPHTAQGPAVAAAGTLSFASEYFRT